MAAIEQGFVQGEIEEAAYRYTRRSSGASGSSSGVNRFDGGEGQDDRIELHRLDPEIERRQLERTARVRAERNARTPPRRLWRRCVRVAVGEGNLLVADARGAPCAVHVGEICGVLRDGVGHVRRATCLTS